jgi:type IV fimbrial biogenesis protein FimT
MLKIRSAHHGFSLIELMVTVSLLVLLVMIAAPSLTEYTQNSKVRAASESFLAGAQAARVEAIRTNQPVQILFTTDAPIPANADTANLSATSSSWLVRTQPASGSATFIEGKSSLEGSGASGATSITVSASSGGAAQSSLTFSGAGSSTLGARWQVDFGSTAANCSHATTPGFVRCQRIIVKPSGQIQSCDPAAVAPDSRAC